MPFLELDRVSFAHSGAVPLFDDLDPDDGTVRRSPRALAFVLCPQTVELRPAEIDALATDAAAGRLRAQLGLEPAELARWESLSPGERKRWQVGAALHAEPDALLLDEPTNHLDLPSIERLEDALAGYPGALVLGSHDAEFARCLTHRSWTLAGERVVID